jgi:hypothetical protein
LPERGNPFSRLKASAGVIAILVRVLQPQYFSQSANFILIITRTWSPLFVKSSFIAWRITTALYDGVSIRLLRRLVQGYHLLFTYFVSVSIAGFKAPHYKQREAEGAKDRHRGAHHVGDESSLQGTPQRHLMRLPV